MLRAIEYTLLGVSLLVVVGLVAGSSRGKADSSAASPSATPSQPDEASHSNKPA